MHAQNLTNGSHLATVPHLLSAPPGINDTSYAVRVQTGHLTR